MTPKTLCMCFLKCTITVLGLAMWRIFSITIHTKHKCSGLHKSFYEAHHPPYCQTHVIGSCYTRYEGLSFLSFKRNRQSF